MKLCGVIVPLVTPLNNDESVNTRLLQEHLKWLLESGIDGVLVGGSMGEYPNLYEREKKRVLESACQVTEGKTTVIVNVSDTSKKRVLHNLEVVKDFPVDAYILTPPYYFLHTWPELKDFFWHISDTAEKPVLAYNIPEFVGNRLSADFVAVLAQHPRIIGLKDSSGDFPNFVSILLEKPSNFLAFQGYTELSLPSLLLGCNGLISGLSNVVPDRFVRLFSVFQNHSLEKAKELQREINRINRVFVKHGFLVAVKYGLSLFGLCTPRATCPFSEVSAEGKKEIEELLRDQAIL